MKSRIDFTRVSPQLMRPLFALGAQIEASGLQHTLLELVKMRASQQNGCAYCLDMHSKDARAAGESAAGTCPTRFTPRSAAISPSRSSSR
jgi:AhpD family alkylhydroperoxidase